MNLSQKIARNLTQQIVGKAISIILGLLGVAAITRYLGTKGFGDYTTINTFLSFFAVVADFGLTLVTSQMISARPDQEKRLLNNLFSFRLISAIIIIGLGPWIIWLMPYSQEVKIGAIICSWSYIFIAFNQTFVGFFQKKLTMHFAAMAEVVNRLAFLGIIFVVIKQGGGLIGIIWATTISSFIGFALHYAFASGIHRLKPEINIDVWKEIFKKSWPLLITITFNLIYLRADTLILSLLKPSSDVGLYGAAYKIIDVLSALPFMFAGLILPIMTKLWQEKNREGMQSVIQKAFDVMVLASIPMVAGTMMLSTDIIRLIAGQDFLAAAPILRILIIAIAFIFLGCIFSHAIIAIDAQKKSIPFYVFTSLTAFIGYLVLIPKISYFGAATITVYSEMTIAALSAWFIIKKLKIKIRLNTLVKSLASSAIMMLFLYLWPGESSGYLELTVKIILGGLIYAITAIIFKAIKIGEIKKMLYGKQ